MISVSFNLVSVSILNVGTVSILLELYAASLLDLILNAAVEGVKNKGRIEYLLESVVNECVGCS
ncbi:unknown [Ruminococcus sp. CAG:488]|nr:unknown [Ruminococcus sp. CAG:488]